MSRAIKIWISLRWWAKWKFSGSSSDVCLWTPINAKPCPSIWYAGGLLCPQVQAPPHLFRILQLPSQSSAALPLLARGPRCLLFSFNFLPDFTFHLSWHWDALVQHHSHPEIDPHSSVHSSPRSCLASHSRCPLSYTSSSRYLWDYGRLTEKYHVSVEQDFLCMSRKS